MKKRTLLAVGFGLLTIVTVSVFADTVSCDVGILGNGGYICTWDSSITGATAPICDDYWDKDSMSCKEGSATCCQLQPTGTTIYN
jgi:hypothetical protein